MKPLNIPNIQDFYPDSPDYGELSERAVQQEVLRRISAEQNKGLKDRAEIEAELAMYKAQNQVDQMKSAANRSFMNDIGSAVLSTGLSFIPSGGGGFAPFNTGITADQSGFSVDDYRAMGGDEFSGDIIAGGGSVYWDTDMTP